MIIVTGGAGFIGSNIVKKLNNMNYKNILIVDNLQNNVKYKNLIHLNFIDYIDKKEFIKQIINNKINIKHNYQQNLNNNIQVIFHQGACSSTTTWNGRYMMKNNYQFSKILLNFCIKYNIPFIYASSAAIYGKESQKFIENPKYEIPCSIYGYSKFLFDQYVRLTLLKTKSQICGLRYFNVYGPHEAHKKNMASIIFQINQQINENKNPKLFIGSENFKRDFIYIDDIININIWAWKNNISGIFNCGTGKDTSFQEIADTILNYHKINNLNYVPIPQTIYKNYQQFTKANTTKIRKFGYKKHFINIKKGIIKYLTWLNTNK